MHTLNMKRLARSYWSWYLDSMWRETSNRCDALHYIQPGYEHQSKSCNNEVQRRNQQEERQQPDVSLIQTTNKSGYADGRGFTPPPSWSCFALSHVSQWVMFRSELFFAVNHVLQWVILCSESGFTVNHDSQWITGHVEGISHEWHTSDGARQGARTSASFLAEISARSPRKTFICII